MGDLLVFVLAPSLTGMVAWLLLRRGVAWRRVGIVPAAAVLLAGATAERLRGGPDPWWPAYWFAMAMGAYGCWLLSWRVVRPVFERLFGTRW